MTCYKAIYEILQVDKNKVVECLKEQGLSSIILKDSADKCPTILKNDTICDWGYHCILYSTFYYKSILKIIESSDKITNDDCSYLILFFNLVLSNE